MPYFEDDELRQYVERELLPGLSEDCAREFYDSFGVVLDRTPESLRVIDGILERLRPEPEVFVGPLGAYLGTVFCCSDGAKWSPAFDRSRGADGYQVSLISLRSQDVDVFELSRQAISGIRGLFQSFTFFHQGLPPGRIGVEQI